METSCLLTLFPFYHHYQLKKTQTIPTKMPIVLTFPSILRISNKWQNHNNNATITTDDVYERRKRLSILPQRPRSMNINNIQDREKIFSSPLNTARKWSKRLSLTFNDKNEYSNETENEENQRSEEEQNSNEEEQQQTIIEDTVNVQLIANDGLFIYRPGQCLMGQILIDSKQKRMKSLKKISIRVQGIMILSRYESDETKRNGRSIFIKKWNFYDSKPMNYTREDLNSMGIKPVSQQRQQQEIEEDIPKNQGQEEERQNLQLPFAFELPSRCISYKHEQRFIREPAPLPPTLQFEIEKDQLISSNSKSNQDKDLPPPPWMKTLKELKNKVYKSKKSILRAEVRYTINISIEWQENFFLFRNTKTTLPFIVQPLPPNSTSFIHSITNRYSRQMLHLPPERNNRSEIGMGMGMNNGVNPIRTEIENSSRSNSRQSQTRISTEDQIQSRENRRLSNLTYEAQSWTDLILKETFRGPQAWVVHHLYKRIEQYDQIELEFSYPATAALAMDKPIPFSLTITGLDYEIDSKSIKLDLLRTIQSVSPSGKLIFENRKPQKRLTFVDESITIDKSIIQLNQIKQILSNQQISTPPPADEYIGQNNLIGFDQNHHQNYQKGIEGEMIINSGLDENDQEIKNASSITTNCLQNIPRRPIVIHPCFSSQQQQEKITIPSFSFRGLCVEYHLQLNFNLIRKVEGGEEEEEGENQIIPIKLQTPSIKLASSTKQPSSLILGEGSRRFNNNNNVVANDENQINQSSNHLEESRLNQSYIIQRRSNIAEIESVLERVPLNRNERQREWNSARFNLEGLNRSNTLPATTTTTRQYPRRPPLLHRTGPSHEITEEMIRSNIINQIESIDSLPSPTPPPRYRSNSDIPNLASILANNNDDQDDDLTTRPIQNRINDELYEILEIEQEINSFNQPINSNSPPPPPPSNLERILNNIPSQRSLRSLRTIDGPAPPYLGTLQDA